MTGNIDIIPIRNGDAAELTRVMTRAFDDDAKRHLGEEKGGPDGYDDGSFIARWAFHKDARCYVARLDRSIAGAIIVFPGTERSVLGCIFVDPDLQRREPLWFMPKAEGQVMETRISDLGAMRAFGFSGTEDAWELPALWRKLRETMQGRGGPVEAGRFLSIFMPDGRFAAAFLPPVGMELPGASGLEGFALAGGIYAIIPHFGPCEAIGPFWDLWEEGWLPGSGWELDPARPKLEWYQGHPELLGAELSLALLCDPVRKRGS